MEGGTKKLLLGGAALLGGILCGWYFYEKQRIKPISTAELLKQIIKEEEREFYPIFKVLAECSLRCVEKAQQKNLKLSHKVLHSMMVEECPLIYERIPNTTKVILQKYGMKQDEFSNLMSLTCQEDAEFKNLTEKLGAQIANAHLGIAPELLESIPDFLTKEKTLEVVRKLKLAEEVKLREYVNTGLEEDHSFGSNLQSAGLLGNARVSMKFSDERMKILADAGLDDFEEAAERILDTAVSIYSNEDPEFRKRLSDLDLERINEAKEMLRKVAEYGKKEGFIQ